MPERHAAAALDLARGPRPAARPARRPPVCRPTSTTPSSAAVALDDLVGDAGDGPLDVVGRHDLALGTKNAPGRGRAPSLSFGQLVVLLSVRASQDPLHGRPPTLVAIATPAGDDWCTAPRQSESQKPLTSRTVAAKTSGMAAAKITSPAWQVPFTVRLTTETPASTSLR